MNPSLVIMSEVAPSSNLPTIDPGAMNGNHDSLPTSKNGSSESSKVKDEQDAAGNEGAKDDNKGMGEVIQGNDAPSGIVGASVAGKTMKEIEDDAPKTFPQVVSAPP